MQTLYPEIKPNLQFHLEVSDGHRLYVEESGSADGIPLIFLHQGPGAGCSSLQRRYCDPEKYRIILFDQRGCGRSEPHASLQANTTLTLLQDLEVIRQHLEVKRWVLMGGGWGSTLALAYAEQYPDKTLGLILRGVFLGRDEDIEWFFAEGTRRVFPDYWQEFVHSIPQDEQKNLLDAFYSRLTGADELARMAAAKAWASWEGHSATLEPNREVIEQLSSPAVALSMARISAHYFINRCFLKANQLLEDAHKLKGIPGIVVQGRYDMICPVENAWSLQNEWSDCELHIIRDAGHSASEAGIIDGLVRASKELHQELSHDCTDPTSD